jgi:hypothetical protein
MHSSPGNISRSIEAGAGNTKRRVHRGKRNAYRIYWKTRREETTRETTALMVEQYQIRIDLNSTSSEKESVAGSCEYDNIFT